MSNPWTKCKTWQQLAAWVQDNVDPMSANDWKVRHRASYQYAWRRRWNERIYQHWGMVGKRNEIPTVCVQTNVVYPSQAEAARAMGLDRRAIQKIVNGEYRQTKGYSFVALAGEGECD